MIDKQRELWFCNPCREDHHMECESTKLKPCDCLICMGEEIGDVVVGDWSPRRRKAQIW